MNKILPNIEQYFAQSWWQTHRIVRSKHGKIIGALWALLVIETPPFQRTLKVSCALLGKINRDNLSFLGTDHDLPRSSLDLIWHCFYLQIWFLRRTRVCVNENASLINPNANILEQSRQKLQKLGKYKIGRNPSPKKGEIYLRSLWLSLLSSLLGSPPRSSLLGSSFTLASDDDRVSLEITVDSGILNSFWSLHQNRFLTTWCFRCQKVLLVQIRKGDLGFNCWENLANSPFSVAISLPPLPLPISVLVVLPVLLPPPVLSLTTPAPVPAGNKMFSVIHCGLRPS